MKIYIYIHINDTESFYTHQFFHSHVVCHSDSHGCSLFLHKSWPEKTPSWRSHQVPRRSSNSVRDFWFKAGSARPWWMLKGRAMCQTNQHLIFGTPGNFRPIPFFVGSLHVDMLLTREEAPEHGSCWQRRFHVSGHVLKYDNGCELDALVRADPHCVAALPSKSTSFTRRRPLLSSLWWHQQRSPEMMWDGQGIHK